VLQVLIGTYQLKLKQSAEYLNNEPRELPIRDPSKVVDMVKNLQQTGVISSVTDDWLTFKANDAQRFAVRLPCFGGLSNA
jgi:Tfp pilus assembly protein PilO